LHRIAIPVRIVYSGNDVNVPPAYNAQYYARSIPSATTLTVPAAGAPGVNRETVHDQVAADAVKFFLASLD
jgi:pimeloyl-ACP methyl ester carboxylesterase